MSVAPDPDRYALCPRCLAAEVEPCPRLVVTNTRVRPPNRVQYLACSQCGYRPDENKRVIPLTFAPAQSHRGG